MKPKAEVNKPNQMFGVKHQRITKSQYAKKKKKKHKQIKKTTTTENSVLSTHSIAIININGLK